MLKLTGKKTMEGGTWWYVHNSSKEMSCFCDISSSLSVSNSLKSWFSQRFSYISIGGDHFRRVILCQLEKRS